MKLRGRGRGGDEWNTEALPEGPETEGKPADVNLVLNGGEVSGGQGDPQPTLALEDPWAAGGQWAEEARAPPGGELGAGGSSGVVTVSEGGSSRDAK